MKEILERLSTVRAKVCVTLILNTHKTHPENQKDPILLKNLIVTAGKRLQDEYGNDIAARYVAKLRKLAAEIDHNYNDLGLMLFVNDDVAEYLRLPVHPYSDRVILDDTFATRTIVRALKRDTDYYILALSKGRARLIEASRDVLIKEVETGGFPVTDNDLQVASRAEGANAPRVANLTREFFNRIDKSVNKIRKDNPLPVVIYSEETNYYLYLKIADYPNTLLGHILLQNFEEKASNLVKMVWPDIKDLTITNHKARISELEKSLGSGKFLSDLNDIWRAVQEGRGKTIFVENGYYQPVKSDNGTITPISAEEITGKTDINDVVDDMIEYNLQFGGDVVFLDPGSLQNFNKIALVTRY